MPGHYTRGIWGRARIWHRKDRCNVCVHLPEHAGHNLLLHPKSGLAMKVVHRLA
jgi:hypothetical protein